MKFRPFTPSLRWSPLLGLLCLLAEATLSGAASTGPAFGTMLANPCPPDSGESSLHRGPDGTIYLTWAGPGDRPGERALRFAALAPGTAAWSESRTIVSSPRLMENWADFATLVVASDGALWAQWFQRGEEPDGHGYEGWCSRSHDAGSTWSIPRALGHEFVSLAPLSGGRVLAVWLESTRRGAHDHAPRVAGAPYAPTMQLKARLLSTDGTSLQEWLVDPDVCNCCQTTLARLPNDDVLVAYRGHAPDETRDNRISTFNGAGWSEPRTIHDDDWKIAACPVNGPAADAAGDRAVVAWFTAAGGTARVQARISADAGNSYTPTVAIDAGRPIGRLDALALPDGSCLVSWLEAATVDHVAGLYVRRIFGDGSLSAARLLVEMSAARASGFPRLAWRDGTDLPVVVSWTDAVPANPADPKSPAATQVRTLAFSASALADVGAQ